MIYQAIYQMNSFDRKKVAVITKYVVELSAFQLHHPTLQANEFEDIPF